MRIVLIESLPDPASVGIASALRADGGWAEDRITPDGRPIWRSRRHPEVTLAQTDQPHIHAEGLDAALVEAGLPADLVVFLSKHMSESGRPTLTVHPLGNYQDAQLGGRPGRLTPVLGGPFTQMLRCLRDARDAAGFPAEVAFEVTHHGPLLATPAFFVELGSTDPHWRDPAGHQVLADAVERFLGGRAPDAPTVVGLGGGHYAPRFTEAALTKDVHFAHLIPTYHAAAILDPGPIAAETLRASPGATGVYYHDGQLSKETRERWFDAFTNVGLPIVSSKAWRSRL